MIFGEDYAAVYDAFYGAKDYGAEVGFLQGVLERRAERPVSRILDLGCGTGAHDILLARAGAAVRGVDISERMLERARGRVAAAGPMAGSLDVGLGDARSLDLGETFDAVVSLFHVMSYQTTDADVAAVLATARRHLAPGGLFVFDFWHGPAVLAEPPSRRERTAETAAGRARRVSSPEWIADRDLVKVVYDVELTGADGTVRALNEEHLMRYFFMDRLTPMVEAAGFGIVETGEWGTGRALEPLVFGAYLAARAQA